MNAKFHNNGIKEKYSKSVLLIDYKAPSKLKLLHLFLNILKFMYQNVCICIKYCNESKEISFKFFGRNVIAQIM